MLLCSSPHFFPNFWHLLAISTGTIMEVYLTAENVRERSIGAVTFLFEPMDYEDLMSHNVLYPDV
jgi:hypothetical protein